MIANAAVNLVDRAFYLHYWHTT